MDREGGNMNLIVSWIEQSLAVNSPVFQQTRAKVERINQMLPKRLHYLVEKVIRLVEMVEGGARWVEKAREKRTSNTTAQEQLKMKLAVSDKENVMNQMLNEFLLLEREVTGSGMDVKTQLTKEVRGLKDNWFSLLGDVWRVSNSLNGNITTTTTLLSSLGRRSIMAVSSSPDRSISSSTLDSCYYYYCWFLLFEITAIHLEVRLSFTVM